MSAQEPFDRVRWRVDFANAFARMKHDGFPNAAAEMERLLRDLLNDAAREREDTSATGETAA